MPREINSHKDVENIVNSWEEKRFRLQDNFYDEQGNAEKDHPRQTVGEVYRYILGWGPGANETHRYGLVTKDGKIKLSVRLDVRNGNQGFINGAWIYNISKMYVMLKKKLNGEQLSYKSDIIFERFITGAAAEVIGELD